MKTIVTKRNITYITYILLLTSIFLMVIAVRPGTQAKANSLPEVTSFAGFKCWVIGDVCNLRSGPGLDNAVMGQVLQSTWLDIVESQEEWIKVKYGGKESWIASYLVDVDLRSKGVQARLTGDFVNTRSGPGLHFSVIQMTRLNNVFQAEGIRGEWVRVTLPQGSSAWIHSSYIKLEFPAITGQQPDSAQGLTVSPAGQSLNIYQTPMKGSTLLGRLYKGDAANYITCKGGYIAVETKSGVTGWVYGPEATINSDTDSRLSFSVSDNSWSLGKYKTTVVTATDVRFRASPGTTPDCTILTMVNRGDVLRVIDVRNNWINAITPQGVVGWVASWLTSGVHQDTDNFSVTLDASQNSRLLTVTGPFESAQVIVDNDHTIRVSTSIFFGTQGQLDINTYEFQSIAVATSDVTVRFVEVPSYSVLTNVPGKVVIEFTPKITSIDVQKNHDNDLLTINTLGFTWPDVVRNGNSLNFFLPGASYAGTYQQQTANYLQSINVSPKDNGLNLAVEIPDSMAYLLKKNENSLEVLFRSPGLNNKTIVIDPGHGGSDPGAVALNGVQEKAVNWDVAYRLANLLRQAGATVHLTRNGWDQYAVAPTGWSPGIDEYAGDLAKRAAWSKDADIFISIHHDWYYDTSVSGTTSYITQGILNADESGRLARLIQREVTGTLGTFNRGIKNSNFFVTRESYCPSVLVELMYLSNPGEAESLKKPGTLDKAALGLFRAIEKFFATGSIPGV